MFLKSVKFFVLSLSMMALFSCGKKTEDEVKDAVLSANILLSTSQCQAAIDLLEAIGKQPRNAQYLKTLASAYACRAGYSTPVFFGTDIAKTATPSPLGGITLYTTSQVTTTSPLVNDSSYKDLQYAINVLLYAGGIDNTTEPRATERAKYFGQNEQGDINTQVAFMMMVQLGKLVKVYTDANVAGAKAHCFTDYSGTPALVQAYVIGILTAPCNTVSNSDPELATGVTGRKARLCQGVVLLNNILDVLPAILASAAGGSLSDISTVTTTINTQKAALVTEYPTIGSTLTIQSQATCEADSTITVDTLASYYAIIFEGLIK